MRYLLDTNTCIRFLNQRSQAIINHLSSLSDDDIALCSVVRAELFYGAQKSQNPQKSRLIQQQFVDRFRSLPFDDMAADQYAVIRAHLESIGRVIGSNDMLIAAIALANDLILVTHNVAEFSRVPNLQIEDWET